MSFIELSSSRQRKCHAVARAGSDTFFLHAVRVAAPSSLLTLFTGLTTILATAAAGTTNHWRSR
jgi:hypothetical protein